jgi:hypothetical protein
VLPRGRTPDSTAFFNDDLLVQADDFLRKNALPNAIQDAAPGQIRLGVSGDMGVPVGRGYLPVGEERVLIDVDAPSAPSEGTLVMLEGFLQEPVAWVEWEIVAAKFELQID